VTISDRGEAVVVLPGRAPDRAAAELVAQHAGWIERHREIVERRVRLRAVRPPLGGGRTLALEGVPHPVAVRGATDRRRSLVEVDDEARTISIWIAPTDPRSPADVIEPWLRSLARRWLAERVSELSASIGVSPASIHVRDQRTRWGSASHAGTLSFNWRLVLCPRDVFDYVVIHELAHLRVRGHSPRFWAVVDQHAPNSVTARRWLREHHDELRHALD
jgi:predicted metal-dependent hydrolase